MDVRSGKWEADEDGGEPRVNSLTVQNKPGIGAVIALPRRAVATMRPLVNILIWYREKVAVVL